MATQTAPASSLARRLTSQDAAFLYNESQHSAQHIGSLSLFDGVIAYDDLVRHIEQRLHLIPRYRQRLSIVPFNLNHPSWEDDPNFDISNHVFRHTLPPSSSEAAVTAAAIELHEPLLDRSRPLWEMHLIEGMEGQRSAVLWKIHHCLVDGVSGIELTTVVMDYEAEAPAPAPPDREWTPEAPMRPDESLARAVLDFAQQQLSTSRRNQDLARQPDLIAERMRLVGAAARVMMDLSTRPVVRAPWNQQPITRKRSFAWSRYEFGEVRGIRGVLGGTVNDVVLTILSEGAARYLQEKGAATSGQILKVGCPVSVRREGESGVLGNRVSMMFAAMPADPMDLVARLQAVRAETERIKAAQEPQGLELMMESADAIPPSLTGWMSAISSATSDALVNAATGMTIPQLPLPPWLQPPAVGISFVATNVPGVQVPQYLAGRRMTDTIGLMLLGGTLGYGVAIGSYNQGLYIGLMAEPRVLPDVDRMKTHVDAAYEELRAAAIAQSTTADV